MAALLTGSNLKVVHFTRRMRMPSLIQEHTDTIARHEHELHAKRTRAELRGSQMFLTLTYTNG
jgi:hypothetical protein